MPLNTNSLSAHSVSLYDFRGRFLGGTKDDLWLAIVDRPCWMVDNNVPWGEVAHLEPDHHFVLGRTMVMESDSLRTVIRRLSTQPIRNVFTLEIQEVCGVPVVVLDRLGSTLQFKFKGNIPTVQSMTPEQRELVNSTEIRERKRQRVLAHEARDPEALATELRSMKTNGHRDYVAAGEASLAAYAIHLRELRSGPAIDRVRRFDENHPNVFGDAELVQEALFLGIGVFSADRTDVGRMASLLGIPNRER